MKHLMTFFIVSVVILVATGCDRSPTQSKKIEPVLNPQAFRADLDGASVIPDSVITPAGGQVDFYFTESGLAVHYRIQAWNIDNITGVYLHRMTSEESHQMQYELADREMMQSSDGGTADVKDELWAIDIASENLKSLHDQMAAGKAYLVITTDRYPAGEIAGLTVPVQ